MRDGEERTSERRWRQGIGVFLMAIAILPLTGCAGFFVKPTATGTTGSTPTSPATSNTGDFAYIANSSVGTTYLSEYSIASNTLNSLGSISLGYIPVALAVSPNNQFLYVASTPGSTSPGIYLYTIGSTGALSAAGTTSLVTDTIAAMAISPDGNWLFTVNTDGLTMTEYKVTTTSGALTPAATVTLPGTPCNLTAATPVSQSCSVAAGPSGAYVIVADGISGDYVFGYSSSGGLSNDVQAISSGYSTSNPTGDFSAALDANNYAYIARTNSIGAYDIVSGTSIASISNTTFPVGTTPRSITLGKTYGQLYTADEGTGTISGFGIGGNGVLTALSGSPYPGPANVSVIAVDNTGGYLVAVGYDASAGVRLYTIASTGVLAQVAEGGTGVNNAYPALIAMTH